MPTSTKLSGFNINKLTKAQFDAAVQGGIIGSTDISLITDEDFEAVPQWSSLPTASADYVGKIVQFIGATDSSYTHGYFYECISDGSTPATYSWSQTNAQPSDNDYTSLLNKPSINSVTLSGNKTSADLGIISSIGQGSNITINTTDPANPVISATGQVNSDWNSSSGLSQILNKPSLATVATSGSYNDLSNKPTIPAAQVNSDWNSSSGVSEILNKPDLSVYAAASDVTAIEGKIPSAASTSNQLADKAFVNSSISNMAANYVTSDAQGDNFASHAALLAGPYYYKGQSYTLTNNDYALVETDEDHSNATTRYMYDGAQWAFQYVVNNAPFTQAQLDAINSTITANKVQDYDLLVSNVQADWNSSSGLSQILNKPSLATVATTGAYSDLSGTPSLATVATSGDYNDLINKPTITSMPCIVVDYSVTATTGIISVETNIAPTTKTVKEIIGGTAISGTWATVDTTHYTFTPTTASDILDNANGFMIKVA